MAINPNEVLVDVDLRLPPENVLTDSQLLSIINSQITVIGDDDSNYAEVVCKSLREAAEINKAKSTGSQGLKSRKLEDLIEEEYYENSANSSWESYLNELPTLCARLGYTGLGAIYSGFISIITDGGEASVDDKKFIDVNPTSSAASTTNIYL